MRMGGLGKRPTRRESSGWVKPQENQNANWGLGKSTTRRMSSGWVKPQKNRKEGAGAGWGND